jgi:hypothetical protein
MAQLVNVDPKTGAAPFQYHFDGFLVLP